MVQQARSSRSRNRVASASRRAPPSALALADLADRSQPMDVTAGLSEYQSYYAIIRQIPRAKVLTYGDVAWLAGRPSSARRVGYALSALKDASVPWWRVVNARGEVSPRASDLLGACELDQRARLLQEGVNLDSDGRIDLSRYRLLHRPDRRSSRSQPG